MTYALLLAIFVSCSLGTSAAPTPSSLSNRPQLCNQETPWRCTCKECWDKFRSEFSAVEWVSLRLDECTRAAPDQLSEKLAAWLNEECGSFVTCPLELPVSRRQLIIGHWGCDADNATTQIRLLLRSRLSNTTLLSTEETAPGWLLGQMVRSRQHLLAFLLHAGLESVDVQRPLAETTPPIVATTTTAIESEAIESHASNLNFLITTSLMFIVILLTLLLIFLCTQNVANWTRVVRGKWRHQAYKKVNTPDAIMSSQ
ncbi:unnamed protein product, partial [Mesorhabditis spiculigera]